MGTTVEDLKLWFEAGKDKKATHMIVATDTFDWEDFPVYVMKGEDVNEKIAEYKSKAMSKVMEVYSLKKKWEDQKMNGRLVGDTE